MRQICLAVLLCLVGLGGGIVASGEGMVPYAKLKALVLPMSDPGTGRKVLQAPRIGLLESFAPAGGTVMLGDSLIENAEWEQMFPGAGLVNRGLGAASLVDIADQLGTLLPPSPKRVLLMAGINDFFYGATVEETLAQHRALTSRLEAAGIEVIVLSTVECVRTVCGPALDGIRALNTVLAVDGRSFVDLNRALSAGPEGLDPRFTFDGVHLNGAGYRAWTKVMAPVIGHTPTTPRRIGE